MDLEKVDKNFLVEHKKEEDINFINIKEEPIKIHGLIYNNKLLRYERMNNDVADSISSHLSFLNGCTSGGRIRFRTNSKKISLKVLLGKVWGLSYYSKTQAVSFSLYINNHFYLSGQGIYTFVFNNKNVLGNFQQGVELSFALTYSLY